METLNIELSDKGLRIDATGFKDKSCLKETDKLIEDLEKAGIKVEMHDQRLKPEGRLNKPEVRTVEYRR